MYLRRGGSWGRKRSMWFRRRFLSVGETEILPLWSGDQFLAMKFLKLMAATCRTAMSRLASTMIWKRLAGCCGLYCISSNLCSAPFRSSGFGLRAACSTMARSISFPSLCLASALSLLPMPLSGWLHTHTRV